MLAVWSHSSSTRGAQAASFGPFLALYPDADGGFRLSFAPQVSIAETSGSGFVGSSWDLGATYGFWASEALSIGPGLRARYTRAITAAEGDPMIDVWTGCASISMTYH